MNKTSGETLGVQFIMIEVFLVPYGDIIRLPWHSCSSTESHMLGLFMLVFQ